MRGLVVVSRYIGAFEQSPMVRSSTEENAQFCIWDGAVLGTNTD